MEWLKNLFGLSDEQRKNQVEAVQRKFALFHALLDQHNLALKKISQLEEKFQGGVPENLFTLWGDFIQLRAVVNDTIGKMVELGGIAYNPLQDRLKAISDEIELQLPSTEPIVKADFIIQFENLHKECSSSVGTKSAHLGELKSKLGLPVPDGFAISVWAYQHFLDANQLNEKIARLLAGVQIRRYQDLEIISEDIRDAVTRKTVPDDLAKAIYDAFDDLTTRTEKAGFALRSSAVGEDTVFSFAGQYLSILNVHRDTLLEQYKQVLASKFTPSAIHYMLSRSLSNIDFGMGVICMEMVDAETSGVLYTVDPLNPEGSYIVVNSVFGLGSYLVEGTLTPDVYHISRESKTIIYQDISEKSIELQQKSSGGVERVVVPKDDQKQASLNERLLRTLAEYSILIEEQFNCPQDIEWVIDWKDKIYLLQARPLKIPPPRPIFNVPEEFKSDIILKGGTPICYGVGSGLVYKFSSAEDLDDVPDGAVLITTNPSPTLVAVLSKISALVTLVGGSASHLATLAREFGVPTIVGMKEADQLPANLAVTVDATNGVIYKGSHPEWSINATPSIPNSTKSVEGDFFKKLIAPIVKLNYIHPNDSRFVPKNCLTLHDILRFIHQKSMEEIFQSLKATSNKDKIALRLKTKIPLLINIIYLDQNYLELKGQRWVPELEIHSKPMQSMWGGILEEGWPQTQGSADVKGFMAVIGSNIQEGYKQEFSENSYAFISSEYMLLNLRMGYHFSTIEAMVTPDTAKNYIRMQFKLGGAPLERRLRRIWLISELLRLMGFENYSQSDFLDSNIAYQTEEGISDRLRLLGRVTILTKQLDMALSSDARARWYFNEFVNKLGLKGQEDL